MKKIIFILILLLISAFAFSQDLSKTVSINSDGATLKDVCEYLSMQTKMDIRAGKSEKDWQVYDRRSVIHVEKVPLKDLMVAISNVFDLTWESDEEGVIYLTASEEQLNKELKLREEYFNNLKTDFETKQQSGYEAFSNQSANNTYAKLLYSSDYYKNLMDFFNAFPKLKDIFLNKKSSKFNYNSLNENQKRILQAFALSYIDFNSKINPSLKEQMGIFQNSDTLSILINPVLGAEDEDIEKDSVFAKLLLKGERNNNLEIVILNPQGIYSDIIGQAMLKLSRGENSDEVKKKMQVDILQFKALMIEHNNTPCENLTGPIFEEKYNFNALTNRKSFDFKDFFAMIHDKCGLNIVADYFYRDNFEIDNVTLPLSVFIQNACNQYEVNGIYRNDILELQDKLYYVKVAGVVPTEWVDYWIVKGYENGGYSLEDLINMSKLNDIQIDMELRNNPDMNVIVDKEFRFNTNEVQNKRYALRFLSSLDDDQIKKIYESKLSAFELDDFQWDLLQKALEEHDGFYTPEKKNSQVVKLTREMGRVIEFNIEYTSDLSSEPITITILTNKLIIKNPNKK
ncbi:MAG: hypothetical protein IJS60_08285 [Abditibacteriota bacterium]|nr:hypothetical protein [Abditibacteriota bacterium]